MGVGVWACVVVRGVCGGGGVGWGVCVGRGRGKEGESCTFRPFRPFFGLIEKKLTFECFVQYFSVCVIHFFFGFYFSL